MDVEEEEVIPFWQMARRGITLLLNNQQEESVSFFKQHPENILMYSGYATAAFIDALMTFEDEKLIIANQALKETERRCTGASWFQSIRSNKNVDGVMSYTDHLETQIIKADAEMYLATLTFLQQDISAYFKGGWILRKSWKNYQHTYNEILSLYKQIVGEPIPDFLTIESNDIASSTIHVAGEIGSEDVASFILDTIIDQTEPTGSSLELLVTEPSKQEQLPVSSAKITRNGRTVDIDKQTITRLMCGVSFGYGLLQLGVSFLPPSIAKLGSFLGFQGDRKAGLSNLMYSRSGTDMRAPLATLAILWYHTIIRPFFALDGNNVQAGVKAASKLVDEAMLEYSESSLFLFFKGRVNRLKSDIPAAIEDFKKSLNNSNQREIKVLAFHEVGWCYLIQLEYKDALKTFIYLKKQSRWSRGFYAYLSAISAGAAGVLTELSKVQEFTSDFGNIPKGSQLEEFLSRRFNICPKNEETLSNKELWKLLVYELLYLWNSLPSCNYDNLRNIIIDCDEFITNNKQQPFLGLCELIKGCVYCILQDFNAGIDSFRKCLEVRKNTTTHADDAHISAFAFYELGQLLVREEETKLEGKQCLQKVYTYKDYDFEQRLSVRVHSILKHL